MPEGPSIILLKEAVEQQFTGREVISVSGNAKIDMQRLLHQTVKSFRSWGKQFLICFEGFTVRVHLLLFGTYLINEKNEKDARLNLTFENGEINFYACSVKILDGDPSLHYDFSLDVMNETWNPKRAESNLEQAPYALICDALLDQSIFSGVGNIIKNEILYRVGVHPESLVGKIPVQKIKSLVEEARIYSFQFLEWKRNFELKRHWLAHTKSLCLRCNLAIIRKYTGLKNRRSFFCVNCQPLYA